MNIPDRGFPRVLVVDAEGREIVDNRPSEPWVMTDHRWNSVHRFSPSGLFQTAWPLLMVAGIFLAIGVGLLFTPMDPKQELMGHYTAVVIIVASASSLGVPLGKYLGRIAVVRLDPEGLSWTQRGQTGTRSWDEVVEVYRIDKHVLYHGQKPSDWNRKTDLRVVFDDGSEIHLDHCLSRYDELAAKIQQASAEHLFPRAIAALEEAGRLSFGPVEIDREGLAVSGHPIAWEGLKRVTLGNGFLHCYEGPYLCRSVALAEIPNNRLLLALLGSMGIPVASPASS